MKPISNLCLLLFLAVLTSCAPIFKQASECGKNAATVAGTLHRLDLNRAIYLKNEISILKGNRQGAISPATAWKINRNRRELMTIANDLVQCGRWGMVNSDLSLADQCLKLAAEIKPTKENAELMKELAAARGARPAKASGRISGRAQSGASNQAIAEAITRGDLKTAARCAASRRAMGLVIDKEISDRLSREVTTRASALLKKARDLYSGGSIDQAGELWRRIIELDPANQEAKNGISRLNQLKRRMSELKGEGPAGGE